MLGLFRKYIENTNVKLISINIQNNNKNSTNKMYSALEIKSIVFSILSKVYLFYLKSQYRYIRTFE